MNYVQINKMQYSLTSITVLVFELNTGELLQVQYISDPVSQ